MKKKLLIVFGGVSSEHDVSLVSASYVAGNIPADKYDVSLMGITKEGRSYLYKGEASSLPSDAWLNDSSLLEPAVISPDRSHHGIIHTDTCEAERIDVAFPVLHGKNGEDGTIQGLFEISGIPYVGCGVVSSSVCMDKAFTNTIADYNNISQAKWLSINSYDYRMRKNEILKNAGEKLGYPIFVKPANAGSSVGISKAEDFDSLSSACDFAFVHDKKIVLEEGIIGREVECAVLGNDDPVASTVGEIVPCNDFYDYNAKYFDASTELHIPARLSKDKTEEIRREAIRVFKALDCKGLARVDFFVRKSDEKVMLNEVNTIPGFTSISMYPKLFEASGISYSDLLDRLICFAMEENV
ncbi:MAG: D-alanine--D-alanine ligase [Clostridia bacterium]|nr:D-alanine--D-alanine ligase [Clostridia bacterium]